MKYVALVYPVFNSGTQESYELEKAEMEVAEKWENLAKSERHPYHMIELYMEALKKHGIPFLYLKGIEAENEEKVKEFAEKVLEDALPGLKEKVWHYLVYAYPYVEQIILDPPEDNDKNGNAIMRGLAVVSALVTAITVGWLRGVWSE